MQILRELLELSAVLVMTFVIVIGGGMGFFVLLGKVLQ